MVCGTVDIQFKLGEDVSNIQIVADNNNLITVEGLIRGVDGRIPADAKVSVGYLENSGGVLGSYQPNGEFSISGVEIGHFVLEVKHAYCPNGGYSQSITEYLDERIIISRSQAEEIFQNQQSGEEEIKLEITLKESGYLEGVVLDSYRNPVVHARVQTDTDLGKARLDYTNNEGKFRISQLEIGKSYSLYVMEEGMEPVLLRSGMQPNLNNIVLVLDHIQSR